MRSVYHQLLLTFLKNKRESERESVHTRESERKSKVDNLIVTFMRVTGLFECEEFFC